MPPLPTTHTICVPACAVPACSRARGGEQVPYLLVTDTADEPITAYHGVRQLLASSTLMHWWAVDNEVRG